MLVGRWKGSFFSLPNKLGLQDNSGWKALQEVPSSTSCPKLDQVWQQVRLLRALCSWVLKTPKDVDSATSLSNLLGSWVVLLKKKFPLRRSPNTSCCSLHPLSLVLLSSHMWLCIYEQVALESNMRKVL